MWKYKGKDFTDDMVADNVGFVYIIANRNTGKFYIGKKLFTKSKRYQKNKKVRKKRVTSDWVEYVGSNKVLIEESAEGHELVKTILHLCKTRGWMSYYETLEILQRGAIQDEKYYNEWVSCKIQRRHLSKG